MRRVLGSSLNWPYSPVVLRGVCACALAWATTRACEDARTQKDHARTGKYFRGCPRVVAHFFFAHGTAVTRRAPGDLDFEFLDRARHLDRGFLSVGASSFTVTSGFGSAAKCFSAA